MTSDGEKPLWWEETDPKRAAELMLSEAQAIEQATAPRRRRNLRHARLYANQDLSTIYDCGISEGVTVGDVYLTMNVTQACVDTVTAKITRSVPRAQTLTERGNASLKRNAKLLTSFLDGVAHQNDLHATEGPRCFVDAALFGSGVCHVYADEETGEVRQERIIPDELLIDETEAINGLRNVATLRRKRYVHRQVLLRRWGKTPEQRLAIKTAFGARKPGLDVVNGASAEMIPVYEAWHLPSSPKAKDGRYMMAVNGVALVAKPYERTRFPFAWLHWNLPTVGVWGRSLAEQLVPVQLKINDMLECIEEGERTLAVSKILVQEDAIDMDHWSDLWGEMIKYKAGFAPPQVIAPRGVDQSLYDSLERWWRHGFEVTGVSMLSATAEKPEGISSAVALRELLDREDMRFSPVGKRNERFHTDIAELTVEAADELYERRGKLSVIVPGEKFIEKIDWGEVNLRRDQYVLRVFPASTLPTTPAGRRQYAQELFELGAIDRARFLELIDMPDTATTTSLLTATLENIERDLENIIEHGRWAAPEPLGDLALARDMALQAYLKARNDEVEPRRLELLRRYIRMAVQKAGPQGAQPATTAEQPQPGAPAPAPGGAPPPAEDVAAVQPAPAVPQVAA